MKKMLIGKVPSLPYNVEEAVNQLRINLGFCGTNVKKILITSSLPNEGKSYLAAALWRQMAEVGTRAVLVDCDLRNSITRTSMQLSCPEGEFTGIAHFLAGKCAYEDTVYETDLENAYLVPLVTNVTNPTMLLESPKFAELVDRLAEEYDAVILDTPPLMLVADALTIAKTADGVVLSIRSGKTPRKTVSECLNLLGRTETPLLGVVLNRVAVKKTGNRYYYNRYGYSHYGYGYGYGNKKTEEELTPPRRK